MMRFSLCFVALLVSMISGKITVEKFDIQTDPNYADVKHSIKDGTHIFVDGVSKRDSDDVVIDAAVYSKIDGTFSPFVRPEPIHVCKIQEHEDPLIKFLHDEILKFGNVTLACPVKKGTLYYLHNFAVNESDFPMPMPVGEFRVDVNSSVVEAGVLHHVCSVEVYFKITKD